MKELNNELGTIQFKLEKLNAQIQSLQESAKPLIERKAEILQEMIKSEKEVKSKE